MNPDERIRDILGDDSSDLGDLPSRKIPQLYFPILDNLQMPEKTEKDYKNN